jgi:hypothetical protein
MSEELTEWLTAMRNEKKYDEHDIKAFEELLSGTITVQEAAAGLSQPGPSQRLLHTNHKLEYIPNLFYPCVLHCAESHEPIIELVKEIRALPKPNEKRVVNWTVWTENLHLFGWGWEDVLYGKNHPPIQETINTNYSKNCFAKRKIAINLSRKEKAKQNHPLPLFHADGSISTLSALRPTLRTLLALSPGGL